jgi:hypothetical protein
LPRRNSIAHVSWLLPLCSAAATLAALELEDGEAEISGVEAAPAFHGQGLDGYAIQGLACLARDQRIWRINMKALEGRLALAQSVRSA